MELAIHTPNLSVSLTFTVTPGVTPVRLNWTALSQDENEVGAGSVDPVECVDGTFELVIPAFANLMEEGMELRVVRVLVTDTTGAVHHLEQKYLLEGSLLSMWKNTAITYYRALVLASQTMAEPWLRGETDELKQRRLAIAFDCAMLMPIFAKKGKHRGKRIGALTPQERAELALEEPALQEAIAKCQVIEAAAVAGADDVTLARRNGLISMTVGESSQFFGSARLAPTPLLSREAALCLSPWLDYSIRLGRG